MPRKTRTLLLCLTLGVMAILPSTTISVISATQSSNSSVERRFTQTVRPFLTQYCMGCHGTATPAAQFDMRPYSSMDKVLDDFPHWILMSEKLAAGQMPPKTAPQPPEPARQELIDWIRDVRKEQARKNAGDPGLVLARRLSNAEYDNTIRDLTGIDLRPAREFPVDPANTAGFDNSAESLVMSPALLNKYLEAARKVADHVVFTPDGFNFAPYPMLVETDRDRYAIKRILDFYASQPTDYADYFNAAWRYRHRSALRNAGATLEAAAAEAQVSAKYLRLIWQLLEERSPASAVGPVAKLQALWRALPAPTAKQQDSPRTQTVEMRDFVIKIRSHTARQFAAPVVRGLPAGSQPLLNWKLRNFNLQRNEFDAAALRNDTDPPMVPPAIPRYPGLHAEAAPRWAAIVANARAADRDLIVPAAERSRYEASFARFAAVFPDTFYVSERGRYFPDDSDDKGRFLSAGYHNVMGYWRDDVPLMQLILDEKGQKQLNRLWDEFDFIAAHTARTWDQFYFNQSGAVDGKGAEAGRLRPSDKAVTDPAVIFGLMDDFVAKALTDPRNDPVAPEAIRYHFNRINDTLRSLERMHAEAEPHHLDALLRFAARAYRRPLSKPEREDILKYYETLRKEGLTHEEAMRESIVSVLMSPKFSYRIDLTDSRPARTSSSGLTRPLGAYALASRLSYFLWASMPDDELLATAESGKLLKTEILIEQARRMLKDPRVRGLALEFGGNWLDFRRFEVHNAVDRARFPDFTNDLRQAMFEEPVRVIEDIIRSDRSVLDLLYGKYTFVNPVLAKHYGMPPVAGGADHWVRVDDAGQYGRGSLLTMSVFLTANAPGLRTSPVKRGYWVVRRLLGETIPPPPPSVPQLPNDEAKLDLPLRDVLAQHRANPACASCHARFDSFGLAFENYGPIGERRTADLAGHAVEADAVFPNGEQGTGYVGVQAFIRRYRQKDFVENISRKLLAYGLGRSLLLSDDLTVERLTTQLGADKSRFSSLVLHIVTSPQFLNRRISAAEKER